MHLTLAFVIVAVQVVFQLVQSQTVCTHAPRLEDFKVAQRKGTHIFDLSQTDFDIDFEHIYGSTFNEDDQTILLIAKDTSDIYWLMELAWTTEESGLYVHYLAELEGFTSIRTITWISNLLIGLVEEHTNTLYVVELGETSRPSTVDFASPFGGTTVGAISKQDQGVVADILSLQISTQHSQLGVEAIAYSPARQSFVALLEKHNMRMFEVDYNGPGSSPGDASLLQSFNSMFMKWNEDSNAVSSELIAISNLSGVFFHRPSKDLYVSSSDSALVMRLAVMDFNSDYKVVEQAAAEELVLPGTESPGFQGIGLANFSDAGLFGLVTVGAVNISLSFADCDAVNARVSRVDTCSNGAQDGFETDVDCGGLHCEACAMQEKCDTARDCVTLFCAQAQPEGVLRCSTPLPTASPTALPGQGFGPGEEDESDGTMPPTPRPTDYWEAQQTPCGAWHDCESGACLSPGKCMPASGTEFTCLGDADCDYTRQCSHGFCVQRMVEGSRCSGPDDCGNGFCYLGECLDDADDQGDAGSGNGNNEGGAGSVPPSGEEGEDMTPSPDNEDDSGGDMTPSPDNEDDFGGDLTKSPDNEDNAIGGDVTRSPDNEDNAIGGDVTQSPDNGDPSSQQKQQNNHEMELGTFASTATVLTVSLIAIGIVYVYKVRGKKETSAAAGKGAGRDNHVVQAVVPVEMQV